MCIFLLLYYRKHSKFQCIGSGSVRSETFLLTGSESKKQNINQKLQTKVSAHIAKILTARKRDFIKISLFLNISTSFSIKKKKKRTKIKKFLFWKKIVNLEKMFMTWIRLWIQCGSILFQCGSGSKLNGSWALRNCKQRGKRYLFNSLIPNILLKNRLRKMLG